MHNSYCGPMLTFCGKAIFNFVTQLSFFILVSGVSFSIPASAGNSEKIETSFEYQNDKYQALVYMPESIQEGSTFPLIIVAPGIEDRLPRFVRATNFHKITGRAGFVVAYPQFFQHDVWEDWLTRSQTKTNHAAGFFRAVIAKVSSQVPVRTDQIYLAGFSTGGILVLSAMCDMENDIAAFGVVSAALPGSWQSRCQPKRSVPALLIASRDDPVVPWSGGQVPVKMTGEKNISLMSVTDTVDLWRSINSCNARPLLNAIENVDPSDRTTVTRMSYDLNCKDSATVLLYAIKGGGHSWPGSNIRLSSFQGAISQDLKAADTIWEFVRKYRLSQ